MTAKLERLQELLQANLGERLRLLVCDRDEITVEVAATEYMAAALILRDSPELHFEQLIDLSGVDYSTYANRAEGGMRFAAVSQLRSVKHNWFLRLRVYADDAEFPILSSLVDVWPSANWYEREAFDLFGIMFEGHPDLRRILTDYGFIGHPFRKDFPVSGHVEMRYDSEQKRIIYQPITIEPREVTPRIVREENYGQV